VQLAINDLSVPTPAKAMTIEVAAALVEVTRKGAARVAVFPTPTVHDGAELQTLVFQLMV
jgi:hypothetical protein